MQNLHDKQWHAEQFKLIFAILFLLTFPVDAQSEDKRLLLISIPDHQLAVIENGQVKKVYAVAVGKESTPSPTGTSTSWFGVVDPTYYHEGKVIAPGPQ